ncbi:MAG: 2-phospho-L-lactate guanylyltransferase [Steroidobacteraceae bacterium]
MRIEALVPLKDLSRGKSRLAAALAEPERVRLIRAMLERVIAAAASAPDLARVSVLTIDPRLVPAAAYHLPDSGEELNAALACAALARRAAGADVLLILAADLPFVTREEIDAVIGESRSGAVVAAPDWKDAGTNALAFPLAQALPMRFGPASLAAHEAQAHAAGLLWRTVRRPGLAFDLDEPAQLEALAREERYAFLR